VKGTHRERRIFRVGFYEKLDDAIFLGINEAISDSTMRKLLEMLPRNGKTFNRFDVTSTPGRRCGENIKGKLPFFLAVLLGFHESLRRLCIATTAGAPSDFFHNLYGSSARFSVGNGTRRHHTGLSMQTPNNRSGLRTKT
jgi:hypothetical protein